MDLVKQLEFLDPAQVKEELHIIGVGAMGSTLAIMLTRMGFTNFFIYDFDTVEDKNVCNQTFGTRHIESKKVDAVEAQMKEVNPQVQVTKIPGWEPYAPISGYIFMCVDSITLRNQILDEIPMHTNIKAIFDFRMGLTDAQVYTAVASYPKDMQKLKASMNFTEEEAKAAMPVSACGSTLSVRPTVTMAVSLGVANFVKIVKHKPYNTAILFDAFVPNITAF